MERTTVRLPDDLLEQAKAHARRTGRTFTQLLEQALRSELAAHTPIGQVAENTPAYTVRADTDDQLNAGESAPTNAQRERQANQLLQQVQELQAFLSALPDLDARTPDEILGYNAFGLPE